MQSKHNKQLVPFAKQLRKEMTKEERHLWYDFLRTYPVRFSRQKALRINEDLWKKWNCILIKLMKQFLL